MTTPKPSYVEVRERHGRKENRLAGRLVYVQGAMSPSIPHANCSCKEDLIEVDRLSMYGLMCKGFSANIFYPHLTIKLASVYQVKTYYTLQHNCKSS